MNRHTDNRQHSCEVCGKAYLTRRDLDTHVKSHTLPYQCSQCEVRTGSSMLLSDHVRIVHEGVQLNCRHGCGFHCKDRRGQSRHEKTCKRNPMPNAPYSVIKGTANRLVMEKFNATLNK